MRKEERAVDIGQALGLAESTLQYIRPNADKIKASDRSVTPLTATKVSHSWSGIMEKKERMDMQLYLLQCFLWDNYFRFSVFS